ESSFKTFREADTKAGGRVLENRYGRERWRRISTVSAAEAVKPPEAPPKAFPRVEVMMSIRPSTPQCSAVPRPVLPTKPVACESSIMTKAAYLSAKLQISFNGA